MLTIGQVARRARVPLDTVPYYERRGLLPPPPRTPAGYRQYGPDTVRRVEFIKRAQGLGFTLEEIEALLSLRVYARRLGTARGRLRFPAARRGQRNATTHSARTLNHSVLPSTRTVAASGRSRSRRRPVGPVCSGPAFWMHQLHGVTQAPTLDAADLARQADRLIAAAPVERTGA
jgi:DNA-binding transcriptional MerR regulator